VGTLDGRDSRRDGKAGVKVRRVRAIMPTHDTQPGRKDLEGPGVRQRPRRGAVSNMPRKRPGSFSPSRLVRDGVVSREGDGPVRRSPIVRRRESVDGARRCVSWELPQGASTL